MPILAVVAAAVLAPVVLFEPVRVLSGSMSPTLEVGDHVLVSKWRYGVRWPLARTPAWRWAEPRAGDVVVFRFPLDPRRLYIKRVVGVPGDTIEMHDGVLLVDGEPVARQALTSRAMEKRLVPADRYFVLGDRRDDSDDSRAWGFVARDDIVGKAEVVWLASHDDRRAIDWSRTPSLVR